ncbi:hypothetical protein [Chryseobacterium tongliaoense]|uniref:hypothetical protein n=1 Tax=Chryseobacterium tongliaoense TaxID=3240933 RepID=UPI0035144A22
MKKLFISAGILFSVAAYSQVGINTQTPKGTLDVTAKKTDGTTAEGFIAPRLTGDQIKAADAQYGTAQKGIIIYATAAVGTSSTKTANITSEGYYYFDGSLWQKVGSSSAAAGWGLTGNTGTAAATNFVGTTDNVDFVTRTNNTEKMRITAAGNAGIGTSIPGTSLDVNGAITNRETAVAVAGNAATIAANTSQVQLTGAATANIAVTAPAAPNAGQRLIVYNNTTGGFPAVLNSIQVPMGQAIEFVYSNSGWRATNGGGTTTSNNNWGLTGNTGTAAATNFVGTTDNVDFVTRTNNTEKMRVTSTGNVGINNTTPAVNLEIGNNTTNSANPTLRLHSNGNAYGSGGVLQFRESDASYGLNIRHETGSTTNAVEGLYFNTVTSGTEATTPILMLDQTNNKVGVGVAAPAATLDVTGKPTDTTVLDGVIPPRITGSQLRAKTYTASQTGAIVYATAADTAPSGQTVNVTQAGNYYFDGTVWKGFQATTATTGSTIYKNLNQTITASTSTAPFNVGDFEFKIVPDPTSSGYHKPQIRWTGSGTRQYATITTLMWQPGGAAGQSTNGSVGGSASNSFSDIPGYSWGNTSYMVATIRIYDQVANKYYNYEVSRITKGAQYFIFQKCDVF